VGKIRDVFRYTAQVLVMNDSSSGVGALLEKSRLHGVVKGTSTGGLILDHIMVDEKIELGERVLTSGGDRIYPKGLAIGTVAEISHSTRGDLFMDIRLKPAVDLNRLDEVLIVTAPYVAEADSENPVKAADILAQRLPGVTQKPPEIPAGQGTTTQGAGRAGAAANPAPVKIKRLRPPAQSAPQNQPAASPPATPPSTSVPEATKPQ
jgi:rod shape-determining protein MreC